MQETARRTLPGLFPRILVGAYKSKRSIFLKFLLFTVCRSPSAARPGGFPARPTRATRAAAAPRLTGTSAEGRRWTCAGQGYSARYRARVRGCKWRSLFLVSNFDDLREKIEKVPRSTPGPRRRPGGGGRRSPCGNEGDAGGEGREEEEDLGGGGRGE